MTEIRIPVRFCRIGRLYGPGMPDLGPEGLMEKVLERPVGRNRPGIFDDFAGVYGRFGGSTMKMMHPPKFYPILWEEI